MAAIKEVTVKYDQTVMDIAIQEYGKVEAVRWIVDDNADIYSAVDIIRAGEKLLLRDDVMHEPVRNELRQHEIVTGSIDSRPEGIGYWRLENDFIIQ
jgi:hypothetical protein